MKSMLVIGAGDFGHHLCRNLMDMKNEVLLMDQNEDNMDDLADIVNARLVADCTSKSALEQVGVRNFDICFVCIGSDFKSNLIIVSTLKELGAKYIVTETDDAMLEKLLLNNGADEVIHPNMDSALRAAVKFSSEHIFDYIHLKAGFSIFEINPLREWVGKSLIDADIRDKYDTYVIAINSEDGSTRVMPSANAVIHDSDKLMVLAHESTMEALLEQLEKMN